MSSSNGKSHKLFGTDGVRGVWGEWPLTAEVVAAIGAAAGQVLRPRMPPARRKILIVRDTRASGPVIQKALVRGLDSAGLPAQDGGVLPTPAMAVLVPRFGFGAGAVISASHNPAAFNGIKFFGAQGAKLSDAVERDIEAAFQKIRRVPPSTIAHPLWRRARPAYEEFLRSIWSKGLSLRGKKIILDCANGATFQIAKDIFKELGAETTLLSARPDGKNINDNCGALHPQALAAAVKKSGAALGAAFDGDGDRAIFVDDQGQIRDGDSVLLMAARHLKQKGHLKKNTVVITVMTNLGLKVALGHLGIQTHETAVGDKYVWEGMKDTGAVLGGEPSGHVIFREHLPTGDGLLTAIETLRILAETGRPFSALASLMVYYPQVLLNVPVREKKPLEAMNGLQREMDKTRQALGAQGRVVVRYSGTEPLLRIMVEGPKLEDIQGYAQSMAETVKQS